MGFENKDTLLDCNDNSDIDGWCSHAELHSQSNRVLNNAARIGILQRFRSPLKLCPARGIEIESE